VVYLLVLVPAVDVRVTLPGDVVQNHQICRRETLENPRDILANVRPHGGPKDPLGGCAEVSVVVRKQKHRHEQAPLNVSQTGGPLVLEQLGFYRSDPSHQAAAFISA
jgi:hypothetical protein